MQENKDLVELFALWENVSKAGDPYFTGSLGPYTRVVMLKNIHKQGKQPDYRVFVQHVEPKEKPGQTQREPGEDDLEF